MRSDPAPHLGGEGWGGPRPLTLRNSTNPNHIGLNYLNELQSCQLLPALLIQSYINPASTTLCIPARFLAVNDSIETQKQHPPAYSNLPHEPWWWWWWWNFQTRVWNISTYDRFCDGNSDSVTDSKGLGRKSGVEWSGVVHAPHQQSRPMAHKHHPNHPDVSSSL